MNFKREKHGNINIIDITKYLNYVLKNINKVPIEDLLP